MDHSIAANTLFSISNFCERNDITLNEVINYGAQLDITCILPAILIPLTKNGSMMKKIMKQWSYFQKNTKIIFVLIKSIPDGNYLFNSASLIVFGNEAFNIELRLAVIIELMTFAEFYLYQQIFDKILFTRWSTW